jgi:very-short-patch-repair endonuclease
MARIAGQPPLTDQEKRDIVTRYQAGEGMESLGVEYHRGKPALRKVFAEAGITPRPRGNLKGHEWTPERREAHRLATSTPEFAEKSRQALLQRLPRMRGPATNTPIERRVQDALMKAGIGFTTQSLLLDRYLVDIEIHQAPIVIEADGSQHTLRIQKAKDAERDAALTAAGYRIFRFTGGQINADAAECIRTVIDACSLVPDQEPIYEIRTRFAGELHPLWKGGKQEFTCEICGIVFLAQPKHRPGPHIYCGHKCSGIGRRGRVRTAEQRARISAGVKGKERKSPEPFTAEHRANISAGLKGKPKSPEHIANAAAAQKASYQSKRESALHGDMQKPAETTGSATLF